MRPIGVFLFLISILAFLAGFSFVMPPDGLHITSTLSLKWGNADDILVHSKTGSGADITNIINSAQQPLPQILQSGVNRENAGDGSDSLASTHLLHSQLAPTAIPRTDSTSPFVKLEFRDDTHSALAPFFERLLTIYKNNKPLRIIHYGDSQIEGDRISGVLRQYFQSQFGGSGPGFICAYEEQGFACPVESKYKGDWSRYARYGRRDTSVHHSRFGYMVSFSRFSSRENGKVPDVNNVHTASITIHSKERNLYPRRWSFRNVDIYYGSNRQPFFIEIFHRDSLVHLAGGRVRNGVQKISWRSRYPISECTINFTGSDSPDIYGIALDDTAGIAYDNIPMRGSSGLEFAQLNAENLSQFAGQVDAGLIILQYGVNVVPNIRDSYTFYQAAFTKQIKKLQTIYPHTPILVIGVSDMAMKDGDELVSYPNIELIRDAQKAAAFDCGCAFWDLYQAMGGHNSMYSWVNAQPPLARRDFTHFNYDGARLVGNMLYRALIADYNNYVSTTVALKPVAAFNQ